MKLFDFFKRKKKKEPEKIKFAEVEKRIQNKKNELKEKEKNVENLIKNVIENFLTIIGESINKLEKVNIDEKKNEDKIKFISKEGLNKYIENLKNLKENLRHYEDVQDENTKSRLDVLSEKINAIITDFDRKSAKNFARANILIGDELQEAKQNINSFLKKIKEILEKNKEDLNSLRKLLIIQEKLKELRKTKENKQYIKKRISETKDKIDKIKDQINEKSQKINSIKQSEEYKQIKEAKEELNNKKEKLNKIIWSLKNQIDFKFLANYFHKDKKKLDIIKDYKENFHKNIENCEKKILDIFEDIEDKEENNKNELKKLKKDLIEGIEKISKVKSEIDKIKVPTDKTLVVEQNIWNLEVESEKLKKREKKEEEELKEIENKIIEKKDLIKDDLKDLNIKIDD